MRHHSPTASLRQLALHQPLFAVCALLSVILLALTFAGAPAHADTGANARCIQEAAQAGLLGPDRNPSNTNFVSGTDGDDIFDGMSTARQDVFCGFDGNDSIGFASEDALNTGDVFLGGAGDDFVFVLSGGTFNGGAGDDDVDSVRSGTFNGGAGDDDADFVSGGGTFNGGEGNDRVDFLRGGTFNGGAGDDFVFNLSGGTFNGGAGNDRVFGLNGGTFNGEAGSDSVSFLRSGTFNGGAGNDRVSEQTGGTFNQD